MPVFLSERTYRKLFQRFKSDDFDVEDQHDGRKEKIFEYSELETLHGDDSCQTQEELSESLGVTQQAILKHPKAMGMIQKQGYWVQYELKLKNVEQRFFTCEQLLQKQNWDAKLKFPSHSACEKAVFSHALGGSHGVRLKCNAQLLFVLSSFIQYRLQKCSLGTQKDILTLFLNWKD